MRHGACRGTLGRRWARQDVQQAVGVNLHCWRVHWQPVGDPFLRSLHRGLAADVCAVVLDQPVGRAEAPARVERRRPRRHLAQQLLQVVGKLVCGGVPLQDVERVLDARAGEGDGLQVRHDGLLEVAEVHLDVERVAAAVDVGVCLQLACERLDQQCSSEHRLVVLARKLAEPEGADDDPAVAQDRDKPGVSDLVVSHEDGDVRVPLL
mmetsp:Transcript_25085/g.65088  ORF Transcript_25085/g.65088 Transcript_25085/m.65088 type:complete len:208 (-) Transcript_25085:1652-2275(-)